MALTKIPNNLITADAISGSLIADDAIDSEHIADGAIDAAHMSANSIDSDSYVDGSIDTAHIGDDQVTADKLANSINTSIAAKLPLAGGTMTGNISHASNFTIDAGANIALDADSGNVVLLDGGAQYGLLTASGSNLIIKSGATTALTFSNQHVTAAGNFTVNGNILTSGTVDGVDIQTLAPLASPAFTGTPTLSNRFKAIDGSSHQLNFGQWDGTNHRIEADSNKPFVITSYHSGGILLGTSGNTKLNVHSTGATVTGTLDVSDHVRVTTDGSASDPDFQVGGDADTGMYQPAANQLGFTVAGSRKLYFSTTTGYVQNLSGGLTFSDDVPIKLGSSNDLSIYHDSNHSYIEDTGTGAIKIKGDDVRIEDSSANNIIKSDGAAALLYYDGSQKLATVTGGVSVTGTVLIDGVSNYTGLEVKGSGASRPSVKFTNVNQGVLGQIYGTESNALVIATGTSSNTAIAIDSSQKVGMGGQDSPSTNLEVIDSSGGNIYAIGTGHADGSVRGYWGYSASGNTIGWHVGSAYNNDAARYDIRMKGGNASDAKLTVLGSGNVGIGTSSPGDLLTLKAASTEETMLMFENNSATSIGSISIHPSNGLVVQQKVSGSSVHMMTHDGNEDINLDSDGFIQFEAAGGERMRVTSAGLTFNGDTAAANALDDYEEGTFTPSYTVGGGGSVTGVTSTNVGTYTKVGRMCTVSVTSNYVGTSGTVPTYYYLALPFQAKNNSSGGLAGGGFGQETGQSGAGMLIKVENNQTNAIIWRYNGTAVPANSYFSLSLTYQTA